MALMHASNLTFDFSRSQLPSKVLNDFEVNDLPKIKRFLNDMWSGNVVNKTENRSALHFATRSQPSLKKFPIIDEQMTQMFNYANGFWNPNSAHSSVKTIINVGIGGSHLGPEFIFKALSAEYSPRVDTRFVSNIDPAAFAKATIGIEPANTFVIFCSKTFTTLETLSNLELFREWYENAGLSVFDNSVAITADPLKAKEFGFARKDILNFDHNIGGRFSISSPIGLVIPLVFGAEVFREFLSGCESVDVGIASNSDIASTFYRHVVEYFGNREFVQAKSVAVLPYSEALDRFPAYLQQLFMESLGKSVSIDGEPIGSAGIVIFGESGTGCQHSFMQYLHQGVDVIPAEFIIVKPKIGKFFKQSRMLALNAIAQANALNQGRSLDQILVDENTVHKVIPGQRPATILLLTDLCAKTLGELISWYENLVVALAAVWNINPFDQWGVELGKDIAKKLDHSDDTNDNLKELLTELGI